MKPTFSRFQASSTILLALLVTFISLAGWLWPAVYANETPAWRSEALGQDIANLAAVPVLLISGYLANRGSLRARLVWAGTQLFLVYAFVIYAFDVHFNRLFLAYVATLGLSMYALLGAAVGFDPASTLPRESEPGPGRLVGGFLAVVAILFGFLWLSEDLPAVLTGAVPANLASSGLLSNPVHVLDLGFLLPGALVSGVQVWRRRAWGYAAAAPLLVFFVLTGVGIVAAMILSSGTFPVSAVFVSVIVVASTGFAVLHLAHMSRAPARSVLRIVA